MRTAKLLSAFLLLALLLIAAFPFLSQETMRRKVSQAKTREAALPRQIFWVWERPEDLHALNVTSAGVAVLEETLRLDAKLTSIPRHEPLILPQRIQRMAVVRIETGPGFASHTRDAALLQQAVRNLIDIAQMPGIGALQIDFDAKKSERSFYRHLLNEVRRRMPPTLPLDITALVSWCSNDDWIDDLPINAATPMFFRMEPDRRRMRLNGAPDYRLHAPLCSTSVGVSTTEPWPQDAKGKRIFVFDEHGWTGEPSTLQSTTIAAQHPPTERP